MPALLKRTEKPAADAIYIAITSFITATDDGDVTVRAGERLSGSHAAVRKCPELFARDGSSDLEIHQQRVATVVGPAIAAEEKASREARAERAKHEPAPIPVARRLRVRMGFRIGNGGRNVPEGTIVDREEPAIAKVVAEYPAWFEEVRPLA